MQLRKFASALVKLNSAANNAGQLPDLQARRAECLLALNRIPDAVQAAIRELLLHPGSQRALRILLLHQDALVECLKASNPSVAETIGQVVNRQALNPYDRTRAVDLSPAGITIEG